MKDINATILIGLKNKTEEELFKAAEYSRRKNVNRAVKSGLTLKPIDSKKDLNKCYNLHSKILKDGGSTPVPYEEWFSRIARENQKYFSIVYKKKPIGYMSVMEITRKFYGLDSDEKGIRPRVFASDKEYRHLRVMDFIYWNTILYSLNNGYNFVDLGGYQIKARGHLKGVNRFKEQWGGELFYFYKDYPVLKALGRKLVRNFGIFYHLNNLIKGRKENL